MEDKKCVTKKMKRMLAILLLATMSLTACGQKVSNETIESQVVSETEVEKESTITSESEEVVVDKSSLPVISLYSNNAKLFSGEVQGFRGDFLAELGFKMEVWAYSDDRTTAILTSGDLPDMMYVVANSDTLKTLIDTDKIINYDDYKEYLPNIYGEDIPNEYITDNLDGIREMFGGVYVLPHGVGMGQGMKMQTNTFDRNVVKLKWDVYEAIGAPEIADFWELIDVMEDMLEYQPTLEDGTKMYGTFLDNGQDTNYFGGMQLWYRWHGYDYNLYKYFTEIDQVNGTVESIFEDDSLYKEGAKWLNEVYRRGLMDPDSISTSRTDQAPKLDNGLAMVPSGTLPGHPTKYFEYFVPGSTVFRNDFVTKTFNTGSACIVINKESENIEECLAYVNMLADPFCVFQFNYGPEGEMWQSNGNVLSITDEYAAWLKETGSTNGFPMSDGTEWYTWNATSLVAGGTPFPGYVDINGEDLTLNPIYWPEAQAITTDCDNWNAWKETFGAEDLWDYCEKNNIEVHTESAFEGVSAPVPDDNQSLTISTIKDIVVPATWQCVYAASEEEFEKIWDQMVEDAMTLGAQDIIDWMIKNYVPVK